MTQDQQPTEAQIVAAARVLANRNADECGVDRDDTWKIYGNQFLDDAKAVLEAALAAQPAVAPIADAASHVGASGVPEGFALVPIEPTETMVVNGFESWPDPIFSKPEEWEAYEKLTGCQQAAHKARLCYAAMLAAAPQPPAPQAEAAPVTAARAGAMLTDEQILALNTGEVYFSETPTKYPEAGHGTQYHCGAPGLLNFARALLAAAAPVSVDEQQAAGGMNDDDLTPHEIAVLDQIAEEFGDCNETTVDYDVLMDFARRGYLDCVHFNVSSKGERILAATTNTGDDQ